jgi:hypothetical protein
MTEALASKTCTPCRGEVPPLTREQAEIFHVQAPEWQLPEEAHHIERSFRFRNFREALICRPCGVATMAEMLLEQPRRRGLVEVVRRSPFTALIVRLLRNLASVSMAAALLLTLHMRGWALPRQGATTERGRRCGAGHPRWSCREVRHSAGPSNGFAGLHLR